MTRTLPVLLAAFFVLDSISCCQAFVPSQATFRYCLNRPNAAASNRLKLDLMDLSAAAALAALPVEWTSTSVLLAETEAWVQPAQLVLDPFLNIMSFAMLARVVLSWYPETKLTDFPWILLVFPTEPLLRIVKGVVPPAFGVDITPVFWLAIFTFVHEILLGQQGLLTMKIKYGI